MLMRAARDPEEAGPRATSSSAHGKAGGRLQPVARVVCAVGKTAVAERTLNDRRVPVDEVAPAP